MGEREGAKDQTREGAMDQTREGAKDQTREGAKDQIREGAKDQTREGAKDQTREGAKDQTREKPEEMKELGELEETSSLEQQTRTLRVESVDAQEILDVAEDQKPTREKPEAVEGGEQIREKRD